MLNVYAAGVASVDWRVTINLLAPSISVPVEVVPLLTVTPPVVVAIVTAASPAVISSAANEAADPPDQSASGMVRTRVLPVVILPQSILSALVLSVGSIKVTLASSRRIFSRIADIFFL